MQWRGFGSTFMTIMTWFFYSYCQLIFFHGTSLFNDNKVISFLSCVSKHIPVRVWGWSQMHWSRFLIPGWVPDRRLQSCHWWRERQTAAGTQYREQSGEWPSVAKSDFSEKRLYIYHGSMFFKSLNYVLAATHLCHCCFGAFNPTRGHTASFAKWNHSVWIRLHLGAK